MKNLLADLPIAPGGSFTGSKTTTTGLLATPGTGITIFTKLISSIIGLMTIIGVIWFVFTFITGAIGIISSGGDKQALESAKKKISTGLIGLVIVIIAFFILDLVGFLLGFGPNGLLNLNAMFTAIQQ